MTQLQIIRKELERWEVELISFKKLVADMPHRIKSSEVELEIELGSVRTFIKMIDKHIKLEDKGQVV